MTPPAGIDVDLMHLAFRGQYDALVLFSGDTDLLPALEAIVNLRLVHVEVACWAGSKPLRFPGSTPPRPWCHSLSMADRDASARLRLGRQSREVITVVAMHGVEHDRQ